MKTVPHIEDTERFFIECCRSKLTGEYLPKIKKSLDLLSDDDCWWRVHETDNSIGNIILHLTGNMRQWIYHSLGEKEYVRDHDKEFSERTHIPKHELISILENAVNDVDAVLQEFPADRLKHYYDIQVYHVTGMEAILHVTEHFSYHTGQIIYITKLRSGKDLKFYNL